LNSRLFKNLWFLTKRSLSIQKAKLFDKLRFFQRTVGSLNQKAKLFELKELAPFQNPLVLFFEVRFAVGEKATARGETLCF
jgi:hypothetical protein